ncbi:hypothetical protein SK128_003916, partial [Halocaridina rubra]
KLEECQSWSDSFCSLVHDCQVMDKNLKTTHLKSCLTSKGLSVISWFQISDQDYDNDIGALTDRFANPEREKQALVLQLVDIPKPKNVAKNLDQFRLDYERILKTLKHYVQSSNWFIAILLQSKLPAEAKRFIFQRFQTKYFTVDQISTGLADHIVFLEKVPEGVKLPVKEIA